MASFDQSTKGDGYTEKLVAVARNAKVVKGGKVFSFSAVTVVGDGHGRIGIGRGKAKEVPVAIQKSVENARKNRRHVVLKGDTPHHEVNGHGGTTRLVRKQATKGTEI